MLVLVLVLEGDGSPRNRFLASSLMHDCMVWYVSYVLFPGMLTAREPKVSTNTRPQKEYIKPPHRMNRTNRKKITKES